MKYSKTFERDWEFYSNMDSENFKTEKEIKFDPLGKCAKEVFYRMDTHGLKDITTSEPELLIKSINAKEFANLQIKLWAESIADGTAFYFEIEKWIDELNYPEWSKKAVENQAKRMIENPKHRYCYQWHPNGKFIDKVYVMIDGEIV